MKDLFDIELTVSQIQINRLRIDTPAFDEKAKSFVIIEYENELDLNVMNQAQEYCNLIAENQEYFACPTTQQFRNSLYECLTQN